MSAPKGRPAASLDQLRAIEAQLKKERNNVNKETKRLVTRKITSDRELQNITKKLQEFCDATRSTKGVPRDVFIKLLQEGKHAQIFQDRIDKYSKQLDEAEEEVQKGKRELPFTHLVEMEIFLDCLRNELLRLHGLIAKPDANSDAVRSDIEAYTAQYTLLKERGFQNQDRREEIQKAMEDTQQKYDALAGLYEEEQTNYGRAQEGSRQIAAKFQTSMEHLNYLEGRADDIDRTNAHIREINRECAALKQQMNQPQHGFVRADFMNDVYQPCATSTKNLAGPSVLSEEQNAAFFRLRQRHSFFAAPEDLQEAVPGGVFSHHAVRAEGCISHQQLTDGLASIGEQDCLGLIQAAIPPVEGAVSYPELLVLMDRCTATGEPCPPEPAGWHILADHARKNRVTAEKYIPSFFIIVDSL